MDHSWGYATDARLREENQDCHGVFEFPDFTLAVVCDGMGGHVGGAQASAIAVRTIHDALLESSGADIPSALEDAVARANQAIYEAARKNHRLMGMGTTVVAAAITDGVAYLAHVGDSRAYLLRGGQVQQITRDHTMVNLFVDAELLTPEDAATHPEAHVLSRSLGVERTVDVELTEPVPLQSDDVIFLCSDGVHGVITDWELGNVDWGAPHEGVQHVMDIVAAREGDDNATAVAVLLATSFEDVPPTTPPEPERLADGPPDGGYVSKGVTAIPVDEVESGRTIIPDALGDDDGPAHLGSMPGPSIGASDGPAPMPSQNDRPSYIVYEEEEAEPAAMQVPDLRKRSRGGEDGDGSAAGKGKGKGSRRLILVGALALLMLGGLGITGAAIIGVSMSSGGSQVAPLEPIDGGAELVNIDDEQPAAIVDDGGPDISDGEEEAPLLFAPELPEAPRRLPHRPSEYTQPPPGGPAQYKAVQMARNRQCAESLDAVREGMRASIDHATLYSQSWFCFNEVHSRPLSEAKVERWEDFRRLLDHFEGPDDLREELPDDIKNLPYWFQPPVGGIEYRLKAWQDADHTDRFDAVMTDKLGEPTVTDQLARDVLMEAEAAAGLSRVEDPNDKVVEWWARRVFVTTSVMNGEVGELIESNRPELVPVIQELLEEATTERVPEPPEGEDAPEPGKLKPIPVPEMVTEAYETGMGLRDRPDPNRPKKHTGPVRPTEPDLDDLDPGPGTVHRPGELIIESPK